MSDKTRILYIEDEPEMIELTRMVLEREGFEVLGAMGGNEGLEKIKQEKPDLILLDLMMPEMDGWEVCRHIRQISEVPIIMLTALAQDKEIIRGLAAGADDYVTKPFNPEVLLARSRAVLRRAALPPAIEASPTYNDGYLTIDLGERRVLVQGEIVRLTATEYRLLAYLVQHAGRVLTFDQILQKVWGEEYSGNAEYVHVYIQRLRKKLEPDPSSPTYLTTEHGIGYQFEKHMLDQTSH